MLLAALEAVSAAQATQDEEVHVMDRCLQGLLLSSGVCVHQFATILCYEQIAAVATALLITLS